MTSSQLDAYRRTTYWAITDDTYIPIRIATQTAEVDSLLNRHGVTNWAFISAANPYSAMQSPAVNTKRNDALRTELETRALPYFRGLGVGNEGTWPPEDGYLVLGITLGDAVELGRMFEQNAVVVGSVGEASRLVLCGGYS